MKHASHILCVIAVILFGVPFRLSAEETESRLPDSRGSGIKAFLLENISNAPSLAAELEATPAQQVELVAIARECNRVRTDITEEKIEKFEAGVKDVLLEHQRKRLDQIVLQKKARLWTGNFEGLNSAVALQQELGLTQAEIESLYEKWLAIDRDYVEELKKDREQIRPQIFALLSEEKRAKYRELFGNEFDYQISTRLRKSDEAIQQFKAFQEGRLPKQQKKEGMRVRFRFNGTKDFLAYAMDADLAQFVQHLVIPDKTYQAELDLTDRQLDELKELMNPECEQNRDVVEKVKAEHARLEKEKAEKGLRVDEATRQHFIDDLWRDKLNEILVKSQVKRLEQLIRRRECAGETEFALSLRFAKELGLTPAEIATIKTMISEHQLRHEELMARTQERLYNKMVEGLPDEIRQKYLGLVGKRFDLDRMDKEVRESRNARAALFIDAFEIKKAEGDPPANKQP